MERPRLLIYDIMQFEGNKDVSKCDHQRRLLCVEKELIQPREEAVSIKTKLSVYNCIYPSTLSIYPSICPSIYPFFHFSIDSSIHPSICALIHPFICPSVHWSIHPSVHLCIDPSFHLSIYPSIHCRLHLEH